MLLRPVTRPVALPVARRVIDYPRGGWSPLQLFAGGEAGAWYDPSDSSAAWFRDGVGDIRLAVATDTIAYVYDKSSGAAVGAEKVVNGTFDANTTGWVGNNANATLTWQSGGKAVFQNVADFAYVRANPALSLAAGWYSVSFDVVAISHACTNIHIGLGISGMLVNGTTATTGTKKFLYYSSGGSTEFQIRPNAAGQGTVTLDNLSVRPVSGNHMSQNTGTSRPKLQSGFYSLDRVDDYMTSESGGGGTTGVLIAAAIRAGGAGTERVIWSDRGTNTGYRLAINSSNQIELSAGNGSAYTTATGDTVTAGTDYVVMGWHDGTNLNVQVNAASAAQAAFVTAAAGSAGFTIGRANGSAANYYGDRLYGLVYTKNDGGTSDERDALRRYMANKCGVTL